MNRALPACALLALIGVLAGGPAAAQTFVDDFEGVARIGSQTFTSGPAGSTASFSGGEIQSLGLPGFYSSGFNSYHVVRFAGDPLDVEVVFSNPVDSVSFFFAHGLGVVQSGTARAFDASGNELASAVTTEVVDPFVPPANAVVTFDAAEPIARITADEGVIDDFTWTALPQVPALAPWALMALALALPATGLLLLGGRAHRV